MLLPCSLSLQLQVSVCRAWAGLALEFRFSQANLLGILLLPHLPVPLPLPSTEGNQGCCRHGLKSNPSDMKIMLIVKESAAELQQQLGMCLHNPFK